MKPFTMAALKTPQEQKIANGVANAFRLPADNPTTPDGCNLQAILLKLGRMAPTVASLKS